MEIDPVCHKSFGVDKAMFQSTYKGNVFYFDSRECKEMFDTDPRKYTTIKTETTGSAASQASAAYREEAGEIKAEAGAAGEKVREIGKRTGTRAKSLFSQRKEEAADYLGTLSNALRDSSKNLKDQKHEDAARLLDRTSYEADRFGAYIKNKDVDEILGEAGDFVRRRPALAIGGAVAAGFLLARIFKSAGEEERRAA